MKRISILLMSLFACTTSGAQGVLLDEIAELEQTEEQEEIRRYTVEVIIFAYAEDVAVGSEIFVRELAEPVNELLLGPDGLPLEGPIPDDSNPTFTDREVPDPEQEEAEEPLFEYVLLSDEELTLSDTLGRLDRLDAYEPLMHFGWTQVTIPEEDTPAIALAEFATPPDGLDGTLTLYLSRYLHLVVDLALAAPETDPAIESDPFAAIDRPAVNYGDERLQNAFEGDLLEPAPVYKPLTYGISENRIMKNGETRYYDHPKFGVIARVSRVEVEEDEEAEDETDPGLTVVGE